MCVRLDITKTGSTAKYWGCGFELAYDRTP